MLIKKMAENRTTEPFRFFRIILPSILEEKKLKIPKKFVKRFGYDELSSVATLMVPNGCVWQVGVTKDNGNIWLDDGWHDFVKDQSICVAYFLVFNYAKNSTFDVLIFDMTACEIDYPYHHGETKTGEQKSVYGVEMRCENSIKKLGSRASVKNQMHNSQGSFHRKRFLNRTTENFSAPSSPIQDGQELSTLLEEMGIFIGRYVYLLKQKKDREQSLQPDCLSLKILHSWLFCSQLRERGAKFISARFTTKHLRAVPKFIKVHISDGREWSFKTRLNHGGLHLIGWGRFLGQMNLDRGDICIFELIKMEADVVLKLSLFHACAVNLKY